ncbi:Ldh family oxidoreductase [Neotabrizicola sp. VNH66]|uniref:Ldh family oxidoreductase n=1 Tax=Neotabrizicola sp. VNH66 TaxID=3400918 RepID=UPI003C09C6B9
MTGDPCIPAPVLRGFLAAALVSGGLPEGDAATVARLMVEADLLGAEGHGTFRLPRYMARLRAGGFNTLPDIRPVAQKGGLALLDGDNAMGHLVMERAAHLAVDLARSHGIGWVGTRRSNHAGAAGVYATMVAEAGMAGLYLAVGNANHMAPWGGTELLLSTNPIAIALPAPGHPVLLDMATTVAAYGKVKLAAQRGQQMPEGWMIDASGNPLTDPAQAAGGSLLPIGGPKGFGLSLMFGLLAGTLNGAAFGRDVIDFNADDRTETNTGQAVLALDLSVLGDPAVLAAQVGAVCDDIRASALRPGFDAIRLPGDRSLGGREDRLARGIPLSPALLAQLDQLAAEQGIAPLNRS